MYLFNTFSFPSLSFAIVGKDPSSVNNLSFADDVMDIKVVSNDPIICIL